MFFVFKELKMIKEELIQKEIDSHMLPELNLKSRGRAGRIVGIHGIPPTVYTVCSDKGSLCWTTKCLSPLIWFPLTNQKVYVLPAIHAHPAIDQWNQAAVFSLAWSNSHASESDEMGTVVCGEARRIIAHNDKMLYRVLSCNQIEVKWPIEALIPVDDVQKDTSQECQHEYVNMGFYTIQMVCKHCDKEKP